MNTSVAEKDKDPNIQFPPPGSTTAHTLELPTGKLRYRAIADWTTLRKVHEPSGYMFHTAYLALDDNGEPSKQRPLTFVFNGGPGGTQRRRGRQNDPQPALATVA